MADATCWSLIEGAAAGDAAARREFAARYYPVVNSYLRARWRMRDSTWDLEDAAQEVFVECLKTGGVLDRVQGQSGRSFRPFLYGVIRNVARRFETDGQKRVTNPKSVAFDPDAVALDETSLTRVFDRAWAEAILREAATRQAQLAQSAGPESVRRVEILRQLFQEGRSLAELSRLWQIEEGLLRRQYDQGRTEFLRALTEVVAFHHPHQPEMIARECREIAAFFG